MQRKLLAIFLSLSIAVSSCGLIYGMTSVDVTNEFETGIVDIRLEEYQIVEDKEVPWEDNPLILPGDKVSKIPRIYNDGCDCYVRVKITFRDTSDLNESNLLGISDKWIKAKDGYYYYTEIIPHGEDVNIFEAVQIPADYSQENEGKKFYIDIDADAIQSQNFEPQFDLPEPWGDVEILECGKEGQYDITTFKKADTRTFSITYQGDVQKLSKNTDDFFANFPYLMPGDTYSDTLTIENDGKNSIKLYFRAGEADPSDLPDKMLLKITTDIDGQETVFYEGTLRAEDLTKDVILGVVPANKTGQFYFEIFVPHELNNQYTISAGFVKWIFSTEEIVKPGNPQTGDSAHTLIWVSGFGLIASTLGLAFVLLSKKKETGEEAGYETQV